MFVSYFNFSYTKYQHIVRVRSVSQEIRANLTDETVTLEFASHDGSTTTMVIDFRNVSGGVDRASFFSFF